MKEVIHLHYNNKKLHVAFSHWRQVYSLVPIVKLLYPEVFRGKLYNRAKRSNRRISYEQIKRELVKDSIRIVEQVPDWL